MYIASSNVFIDFAGLNGLSKTSLKRAKYVVIILFQADICLPVHQP